MALVCAGRRRTRLTGNTMELPKVRLLFYTLLVFMATLFCITLLPLPRLNFLDDNPRSPSFMSEDDKTRAANTGLLNLLHSNMTRQLVNGSLPVDPKESKSWSPFQKDSPKYPCSQYKTRFGIGLPRVWLVSFPRSGNTWTRYLLEAASGIFTGSVYLDRILLTDGYLGERDPPHSQRTLVQKTHLYSFYKDGLADNVLERFSKNTKMFPTILLLRNPAKSILSFYKFKKNRQHPSRIPASEYKSKAFRVFVEDEVRRWMEIAQDRLMWTEAPLYVMHYEHLVENPIKEISSLLGFLGVPVHEGRLACLSLQFEGKFKSEESEPRDPYTPLEKRMMLAGTQVVNRTLQFLGYPPLPTYHL